MTIRFCDVQKGKIAVETTLFFSRGNSKTIMAIRLTGGNRMIWSWQDKSEAKKDGGIRRPGETEAKHGQLAVGNGGESRYLRTGKGDRYHDARWREARGGGRGGTDGRKYKIGYLYRCHPTRKLNQKERNEEPGWTTSLEKEMEGESGAGEWEWEKGGARRQLPRYFTGS